jgi:hypothetical protein
VTPIKSWIGIICLFILCGGWVAARAFRFKRWQRRDDEHHEKQSFKARQSHFRGSLEFEKDQGIAKPESPPKNSEEI